MGVKSCSRENCGSIMCDAYVRELGYICDRCKREFSENFLPIPLYSEEEIMKKLTAFIKTPQIKYSDNLMSVGDFFRKHST